MKKLLKQMLIATAIAVASAGNAQVYEQPTNLPAIHITTPDGLGITSKEVYKSCKLVYRDGDSLAVYENTKVRGRGNSTWQSSDKKPYRIKFAKSQKFLGKGFAKNKSWTLLANAGDKSMIRNALTYDLGKFVGMPFCPAARFADLFLDGSYRGTYQISDHVNVDNKRVEVNDTTGYLFEFVQAQDKSEEPHVKGKYGWIDIKNPDPVTSEQLAFVEQFFNDVRSRLESNVFTTYADPRSGYRAKIDTATLVNWYVASEITGNWDALYSVKCYMEHDGKLCFGPLWDEDLGWNNNAEVDLATSLVGERTAIPGYRNLRPLTALTRKLWQDPWFANAVTMRLNSLMVQGIKQHLINKVDSLAQLIEASQSKNYQMWSISQSCLSNMDRFHSYRFYAQYVDQLKNFISTRIDFLQTAFEERNKDNRYLCETAASELVAENNVNVVLRRNAKADMWNTLCLPFGLQQSEIIRVFGTGTKVARFTSVNDDVLNFTSVEKIDAGIPYLVKPTLEVDEPFSFQQVAITANSPSIDSFGGYSFVGVFEPTTIEDDGRTYFVGVDNKLMRPSKTGTMKGYRAYFTTPAVSDIRSFVVDGTATSLSDIYCGEDNDEIFDLQGRKVEQPAKGIYIKNNKKVVIK